MTRRALGVGRPRPLTFLKDIRFEHTVFALPFAYMTLFLAADGLPQWQTFLWITVAMVGARTFGMAANRLADAELDGRNSRTARWALPAGRIGAREVWAYSGVALALLLLAVFNLSPLCRYLWPAVIAAMAFYPYTKRFTWANHLALGLVYLMVPTGVWIAVHNGLSLEAVLLGIAAGLWVAGFDTIYACQDIGFDRREGLHSLPADFGLGTALTVARLLHMGMVVALFAAGPGLGVGPLYYVGVGATAILLHYEHGLVSPQNLSRVNAAFFTMNGLISIFLFLLVAADSVIR
ncbi:MAG TPA: UbiA-like polyprenyltransferase [Dehalococcoidia bacterium]|nr:UbiA-like polyprenyltransferase [Dehalococcoidia bacterium]